MLISTTIFLLLAIMIISKPNSIIKNRFNLNTIYFILVIILTWYISLREPISDTAVYIEWFNRIKTLSLSVSFIYYPDILFTTTIWLLSNLTSSPIILLFVLWLIFFSVFNKSLNNLFNYEDKLIIFFSYTTYPFFYSLATNVLRQGLSVAILFLIISYYIQEKKDKKIFLLMVAACLFHWSAVPFCIILILLNRFNLNIKLSLMVWGASTLLFITSSQTLILGKLIQYIPKMDIYQSSSVMNGYNGVNRIDFLVFSLFWIIIGLALYYTLYRNETYKRIINLYINFNTAFLLLGFVAFSDRIAIYSWMIIPLLIWYPIIKSKKRSNVLVAFTMLLFLMIGFLTNSMGFYGF